MGRPALLGGGDTDLAPQGHIVWRAPERRDGGAETVVLEPHPPLASSELDSGAGIGDSQLTDGGSEPGQHSAHPERRSLAASGGIPEGGQLIDRPGHTETFQSGVERVFGRQRVAGEMGQQRDRDPPGRPSHRPGGSA